MWSGLPHMITHQIFFRALLIASCGYALWRGRSDERIVALAGAKQFVPGLREVGWGDGDNECPPASAQADLRIVA